MGSLSYSNSPSLGWVVQKFGGTSVGKFPDKVCYSLPSILGETLFVLSFIYYGANKYGLDCKRYR